MLASYFCGPVPRIPKSFLYKYTFSTLKKLWKSYFIKKKGKIHGEFNLSSEFSDE